MQKVSSVLPIAAAFEMNEAMQTFWGTKFITSDYHKESNSSIQKRDKHDIKRLIQYMNDKNQFKGNGNQGM